MTTQNTLDFIKQDIDECRRNIKHIGEQLEFLTGKREAAEFKLKALIEAATKRFGLPAKTIEVKASDTIAIADSSSLAGTDIGFRKAVRIVLNDSTKGLPPRDIASELMRRGFKYEATTDLSTRISNELYRMKRSGQIVKRGNLYHKKLPKREVNDVT